MTEEIVKVKRIECDLCSYRTTVETTASVWAKPKTPPDWGTDLRDSAQLCPKCLTLYNEGYKSWYDSFKLEREGKGKE